MLRLNGEIRCDPDVVSSPLHLALVDVGPVSKLIDVADHSDLLSDFCLVLDF